MPTLHRLATLRDDVIYFIALYQSWIYRVDYRRVNEFGQGGGEDDVELLKEAEAKKNEGKEAQPAKEGAAQATGAEKKEGKGRKRK